MSHYSYIRNEESMMLVDEVNPIAMTSGTPLEVTEYIWRAPGHQALVSSQ